MVPSGDIGNQSQERVPGSTGPLAGLKGRPGTGYPAAICMAKGNGEPLCNLGF